VKLNHGRSCGPPTGIPTRNLRKTSIKPCQVASAHGSNEVPREPGVGRDSGTPIEVHRGKCQKSYAKVHNPLDLLIGAAVANTVLASKLLAVIQAICAQLDPDLRGHPQDAHTIARQWGYSSKRFGKVAWGGLFDRGAKLGDPDSSR
jgi:hypothetical protein